MGSSILLQTILVPMEVALFRLDRDGFASLRCLHCCELLELHQPAEDIPERLIGVCQHCCGPWHIIDLMEGRLYALVVLLPPSQTFQDTLLRASARPLLLLVEDDQAASNALRGIFDRLGWDVLHVTTVAEALSFLSAAPKCVILDLMLPDGDGLTVLKKIRSENIQIRVAVITGLNDPARLRAVSALRPEVFLPKPISLHDLLAGLGIGP